MSNQGLWICFLGFVSTGKENEELFFKSKNLTLSLIASENFDEVKKPLNHSLRKTLKLIHVF